MQECPGNTGNLSRREREDYEICPRQMVGILMTHQDGPLDFDPTATNRRVPLKVVGMYWKDWKY